MLRMVTRRIKKLLAWAIAVIVLLWLAAGAYWVVTAL
jgi:hypothetical protein